MTQIFWRSKFFHGLDSLPRIICGDANKTTLVSVSGVQVADHALAARGLDQQDWFTQKVGEYACLPVYGSNPNVSRMDIDARAMS